MTEHTANTTDVPKLPQGRDTSHTPVRIALAGNPNVGKSTLFNALTGMKQHTGNWSGKTVSNAYGTVNSAKHTYTLVDIPGTYSLIAHSAEEEIARNFLCFGETDGIIVVCDATCLERNLNLALQCIELTENVLVTVNMMDEAQRKGINIDLSKLSSMLKVPVIGISARDKNAVRQVSDALDRLADRTYSQHETILTYPESIERAICQISEQLSELPHVRLNLRWLSLQLLLGDEHLISEAFTYLETDADIAKNIYDSVEGIRSQFGWDRSEIESTVVSTTFRRAEKICGQCISKTKAKDDRDIRIDRILTSKRTGYPIMLLTFIVIFWITISGANYPSAALSRMFSFFGDQLDAFLSYINTPPMLHGILVSGLYRVLTWVISVMLPPMAIFFPLFTILEDLGYLPRIAYNLDRQFKRCNACGKQALTMCMGFGCNAVGVMGARIIDSPRERMLAVLTNNFVPCNGRFPALIAIASMFFIYSSVPALSSALSALILGTIILLSVCVTFIVTFILSKTALKGAATSYTLELPPYRRPQVLRVLIRSIFDRTLFVLGRAVSVAAPAGVIIYLLSNIKIADISLIKHCADFLDPLGCMLGLDGVILISFIFGLPANEIVLPIMLMLYTSGGTLVDTDSIVGVKDILISNGWDISTAVCFVLFSLFHFPCSTTLITIKKETGSLRWTVAAALIPTLVGCICCMAVSGFLNFVI